MIAAIIDTHPVFAGGLSRFLNSIFPDMEILSSLSLSAFSIEQGRVPDLVFIGVNGRVPKKDVDQIVLIQKYETTRLIIMYDQIDMVLPLLTLGGNGFFAKNNNMKELEECITLVLAGKRYLDNEIAEWLIKVYK